MSVDVSNLSKAELDPTFSEPCGIGAEQRGHS
jgi:hypothetical protein